MQTFIYVSALILAFAVAVDAQCFDMEKYKEEGAATEQAKKLVLRSLKRTCSKQHTEEKEIVKCVKDSITNLMNAETMKEELVKYLVDESKKEAIFGIVDECFKDKQTLVKCYADKIVALCPETKECIDKAKKEYPAFFE